MDISIDKSSVLGLAQPKKAANSASTQHVSTALTPRLPPEERLLDVASDMIAQHGCGKFDMLRLLEQAGVNERDFARLYSTPSHLFQAVFKQFYDQTKNDVSKWAMNLHRKWSTQTCFEAYIFALRQCCQHQTFINLFHRLFTENLDIWSIGNYRFDALYLDDCWLTPLSQLFFAALPKQQAMLLAKTYSESLKSAAQTSAAAVNQALNELINELPKLFNLTQIRSMAHIDQYTKQ